MDASLNLKGLRKETVSRADPEAKRKLEVWSVHPESGVSYTSFEESRVARAMIDSADRVVALASIEKLGTASPFVSAPVSALTHLATEPATPEKLLKPYRELGIPILQEREAVARTTS